jgi:hypothetical protein
MLPRWRALVAVVAVVVARESKFGSNSPEWGQIVLDFNQLCTFNESQPSSGRVRPWNAEMARPFRLAEDGHVCGFPKTKRLHEGL